MSKLSPTQATNLREHMATMPPVPEPDPDPEVNVASFDEGCEFDDWAEQQLELPALPVASPALVRETALERDLAAALVAVGEATDDDMQTAPTARNIAEHLWMAHPEDGEPWGGARHQRAERLLMILAGRGAVFGHLDLNGSCYEARDDEPAHVTRWSRHR